AEKYGVKTFENAMSSLMDFGEQVSLRELARLPKGTFELSEEQDDGRIFNVKITIADKGFIVDLRDNPDQSNNEVARVMAAIERHQLQRVDHIVVGDPDDAARRLVRPDPKLFADGPDGCFDRLHVGDHGAAAEIVLVDPAEPKTGVGRRRLAAAAPVGRRARHGAGGLGADMQLAE